MARAKIKDTARLLGIPEQSLRLWLQTNNCPFGSVLIDKKGRYGRRTYYISEERLELYLTGKL